MELATLLRETLDGGAEDVWENERTPTPVRRFGVRLQSVGLSVRETEAVLGWLGVDRSHGAVWRWNHRLADAEDPPTAQPRRVAVDETAVRIGGTWHWVYAAIDVDSKLLLDIELCSHRGTDTAAAFLHRLTEKHDLSET
jgi:putative transposase